MKINGNFKMGATGGRFKILQNVPAYNSGSMKFYVTIPSSIISFDSQGGVQASPSTKQVFISDANNTFTYGALPTVTRTGYQFLNWRTLSNGGLTITSDTQVTITLPTYTLFANWEIITYAITYNMNGGTNNEDNPSTYNVNSSISFQTPTRIGYNFNGWSQSTIPLGSTGNITVTANWTAKQYTVTFNHNGGSSSLNTATVTYGTFPSTVSPLPTRFGYTFAGYYTTSSGFGIIYFNTNGTSARAWDIDANTTLFAQWTANVYSVTLNKDSGTGGTSSITATFASATPAITAPSRTHYNFQGYYTGTGGTGTQIYNSSAGAVSPTWNITNTTLYAYWIPIEWTITYNLAGGTNDPSNPTSYNVLTSPVTLLDPTRAGYIFDFWNPSSFFIPGQTTGNLVFSVNSWEIISYTVILDKQGGGGGTNSVSGNALSNLPNISIPSREHYNFNGYYANTAGGGRQYYTNAGVGVSTWDVGSNGTIYASWIPIQWTITYVMNGGTNNPSNPTSYNIESSSFGFSTPTRTGYNFAGWSNTFIIPGQTTGDITITASWTPKTYTINFDKQEGTGGTDSVIATFNSTLPTITLPTRVGYVFQGYYTQPGGFGNILYSSTGTPFTWNLDVSSPTNLFALWTESGSSGGGCIAVDTPIVMEDGTTRRAGELYVGDRIRSYVVNGMIDEDDPDWINFTTESTEGTYEISTVRQVDKDWFKEYYFINNDLKITKQHEIFVKNSETELWGWVEAPNIKVGDSLFGINGEEIKVTEIILVPERLDVITLNVEETDTYFGGNTPVLIHNKGDLIKN